MYRICKYDLENLILLQYKSDDNNNNNNTNSNNSINNNNNNNNNNIQWRFQDLLSIHSSDNGSR